MGQADTLIICWFESILVISTLSVLDRLVLDGHNRNVMIEQWFLNQTSVLSCYGMVWEVFVQWTVLEMLQHHASELLTVGLFFCPQYLLVSNCLLVKCVQSLSFGWVFFFFFQYRHPNLFLTSICISDACDSILCKPLSEWKGASKSFSHFISLCLKLFSLLLSQDNTHAVIKGLLDKSFL